MKNQCDGCCAGLPVNSQGHHVDPCSDFFGLHMVCQRKLYEPPANTHDKPLDTVIQS